MSSSSESSPEHNLTDMGKFSEFDAFQVPADRPRICRPCRTDVRENRTDQF